MSGICFFHNELYGYDSMSDWGRFPHARVTRARIHNDFDFLLSQVSQRRKINLKFLRKREPDTSFSPSKRVRTGGGFVAMLKYI